MKSKNFRQSSLFIVANLGSGGFHYAYQILAGRALPAAQFAAFSAWFAQVSAFFVLGGLLQYASVFNPARISELRRGIYLIGAAYAILLWAWPLAGDLSLARAAALIAGSSAFAWLLGQAQIRLKFELMSMANVAYAVAKVGLLVLLLRWGANTSHVSWPLLAAYLPGVAILTAGLWSSPGPLRIAGSPTWGPPIILSVAGALIPQFDLLLMHATQSDSTFQEFARASLFFKGIYFVVFVFAQWLLPMQLRGTVRTPARVVAWLVAGAIVASAATSFLTPATSRWVLGWPEGPDRFLVFFSCLHMSLLALLFLVLQESCARMNLTQPATVISVLAIEAAAQLVLQLPSGFYLVLACALQSVILLFAVRMRSY